MAITSWTMAPIADTRHSPISGEVAAGPGHFRRVILDKVLITGEPGEFTMAGLESRIEVTSPTITDCAVDFWAAMFELVGRMEQGFRPSFARSDAEFTEFFKAMGGRVLEALVDPPSDGEPVEFHCAFYEGGCPKGANPKPVPLCKPPKF